MTHLTSLTDISAQEAEELKELAYKIWNTAILQKGDANNVNAQLRQVACDCLSLANVGEFDIDLQHTLVKFYAKTGKVWAGNDILFLSLR